MSFRNWGACPILGEALFCHLPALGGAGLEKLAKCVCAFMCVFMHIVWGGVAKEASGNVTLKSRSQGRLEISISKGKGITLGESVPRGPGGHVASWAADVAGPTGPLSECE